MHLWACVCSCRGPKGPQIPESCRGKASALKCVTESTEEEPHGAACEHLGKLGVSG